MPEHSDAWATVAWFAKQDPETVHTTVVPPKGVPPTVAGSLVHLSRAILDLRNHKADE